ncbi:aspartate-semialdehyde dehydrogenase [bacterium]|nr:aspartate-semialdehyde dehydrogenase [bacterium]
MDNVTPSIPTAVIGATGTVGRRFVRLLERHPWFTVKAVAASSRSAGMPYAEVLHRRDPQLTAVSSSVGDLAVLDAGKDIDAIASACPLVFSALSLDKQAVRELEEAYAGAGAAVVSNNSAHRWTPDVPMIMPEINPHHADLIDLQRKSRGWSSGLIAVKPNCSVQSFLPVLEAFRSYRPLQVVVSTYQAVSGAGRSLQEWPEMHDNVIPLISGEEEKTEREPLRIWGRLGEHGIEPADTPVISATCVRVPVSDGHLASVNVKFARPATAEQLITSIKEYTSPISSFGLPSSPDPFLTYFSDPDRPQTALDRDAGNGMGITVGRIRSDSVFDWKFVSLSHNTLRGAAGGAVLLAELLVYRGFIKG